MRLAISIRSNDQGLDAPVESTFGRAPYFMIVDSETGAVEKILDNSRARDLGHGAGIEASTLLVQEGVDGVMAGFVGPKAFSVLSAAGIKVFTGVSGSVKDALDRIKRGELTPDAGPSCNGHSMGQGRGGRGRGMGMGRGRGV